MPQRVTLTDDVHRPDALVDPGPPGEHDHRAYLTRRQSDLHEVRLRGVREVGQRHHVVRDVSLAAQDPPLLDADLVPRLGVDDEHAPGPDEDQIDLSATTARPTAVWKQVPANGGQRREDSGCGAFGRRGQGVVLGRRASTLRFVLERLGTRQLPARLPARRVACRHGRPLPPGSIDHGPVPLVPRRAGSGCRAAVRGRQDASAGADPAVVGHAGPGASQPLVSVERHRQRGR